MRRLHPLLVVLVFVALALPTAAPADSAAPRIVNGSSVSTARHDAMWPFIVSIGYGAGSPWDAHGCGGVLLHPRLVLTAAHCVDDGVADSKRTRNVPGYLTVYAGSARLDKPKTGQRRQVQDVFVHRGYGDDPATWNDDVALLRLTKPVVLGRNVKLAKVVAASEDSWWGDGDGRVDTAATGPWVAGWGNTLAWEPHITSPKVLQEVRVPIVADEQCAKDEAPGLEGQNGSHWAASQFLCAGALDSDADPTNGSTGRDACTYDSGGPLVAGDGDGAWRVVGLVSNGVTCAGNFYLSYVRLAAYRAWVRSIRPASDTGIDGMRAVSRLRTDRRTRSSVTVSWKAPGAPRAADYVVYLGIGGGSMRPRKTTTGTSAKITGLEPDAWVDLWVVARSASGAESPMRHIRTWTKD